MLKNTITIADVDSNKIEHLNWARLNIAGAHNTVNGKDLYQSLEAMKSEYNRQEKLQRYLKGSERKLNSELLKNKKSNSHILQLVASDWTDESLKLNFRSKMQKIEDFRSKQKEHKKTLSDIVSKIDEFKASNRFKTINHLMFEISYKVLKLKLMKKLQVTKSEKKLVKIINKRKESLNKESEALAIDFDAAQGAITEIVDAIQSQIEKLTDLSAHIEQTIDEKWQWKSLIGPKAITDPKIRVKMDAGYDANISEIELALQRLDDISVITLNRINELKQDKLSVQSLSVSASPNHNDHESNRSVMSETWNEFVEKKLEKFIKDTYSEFINKQDNEDGDTVESDLGTMDEEAVIEMKQMIDNIIHKFIPFYLTKIKNGQSLQTMVESIPRSVTSPLEDFLIFLMSTRNQTKDVLSLIFQIHENALLSMENNSNDNKTKFDEMKGLWRRLFRVITIKSVMIVQSNKKFYLPYIFRVKPKKLSNDTNSENLNDHNGNKRRRRRKSSLNDKNSNNHHLKHYRDWRVSNIEFPSDDLPDTQHNFNPQTQLKRSWIAVDRLNDSFTDFWCTLKMRDPQSAQQLCNRFQFYTDQQKGAAVIRAYARAIFFMSQTKDVTSIEFKEKLNQCGRKFHSDVHAFNSAGMILLEIISQRLGPRYHSRCHKAWVWGLSIINPLLATTQSKNDDIFDILEINIKEEDEEDY